MRAIVVHAAKDLRVEEREAAGAPGPGQARVRLAAGGVCGSDLHYYAHGGFGPVTLREPMILGHEVSGHIEALGPVAETAGVARAPAPELSEGDLVAISPSRPCGMCVYCVQGRPNHCLNMRFYGSAMPFPHIQGAFREEIIVDRAQCVRADGLTPGEAAMAEPLSVCLHGARRAGELLGKRVLVTGCGPIGALCVLVARRAGAAEIVVTDLAANAIAHGRAAGADRAINLSETPDALSAYTADKGRFDVMFECSGSGAALSGAIPALRPRGVIVQLGVGPDMTLPMLQITAKELDLRGSFRFHEEFATAVSLMRSGLLDVKALITHTLPLERAVEAFEVALDRSQAMKAQIAFG